MGRHEFDTTIEHTDSEWREACDELRDTLAEMFGPVVGTFSIEQIASNGGHPEEVRKAWVGVPLPVRESSAYQSGDDIVNVFCADGFNALVEAGVDEHILQYWIDQLDGVAGVDAKFGFQAVDGEYTSLLS